MSPRASARLKKRIANRPPAHPPCNTTSQASTSRPVKRQKNKAAFNVSPDTSDSDSTKEMQAANHVRAKGRKGKLRAMTEMPMDILFEIFGQLEPVDLLHLSRATKGLRSILIAPNATFLWKMAYENLSRPPPVCPPEVNLRHYTNFLYGTNCQFCASAYGIYLHYTARVRFCRECTTKCFQLYCYRHRSSDDGVLGTQALDLCSHSNISKRMQPFKVMNAYVLKIEYDQKLRALQEKRGDATALNVFCREQNILQTNRRQYGGMIKYWWIQHQAEHAAKLAELRSRRSKALVQRIHAEGYGGELDGLQTRRLPGFKSTNELSEKNWKRIKPRLIWALEHKRQNNLKRKMVDEFTCRIQQLSGMITEFHSNMAEPLVVPPTVHFAKMTPCVDLIKNTSVFHRVAESEIRDLTPYMHGITASWRELADKCLLDLLPQKSTSKSGKGNRKGKENEPSTSLLELATSFFKCHWCREPISYPRILMHRCLRERKLDDSEEKVETKDDGVDEDVNTDEEDEEDDRDEDEGKHRPEQKNSDQSDVLDSVWSQMSSWYGSEWNEGNNQVTFDNEASGVAEVIVKVCGEDPGKVTFDQMDKINGRVECLRCFKKGQGRKRLVMNWTTAILHDINKHSEEALDEKVWLLIDDKDIAKAKVVESKLSTKWRSFIVKTSDGHSYLPLDTPMTRPPYAVRI